MRGEVDVPDRVQRKAEAVGDEGRRWLRDLARVIEAFESEWQIEVGAAIVGGSGAFVANAVCVDGSDAVLKLAIPDGLAGNCPFDRELHALRLGAGRGFVHVIRADEPHRAMLQERLGRPLSQLGLSIETQIDAIAATVSRVWHRLPEGTGLRNGAEQAQWLAEFVSAQWEQQRRPCPYATITQAVQYAHARRDAFDDVTAVLIHGDAHPTNVLEATRDETVPASYTLIDPDGMRSEPAHDLAIPLRDWSEELLAATDAAALALAWCARSSENTGVDARAIWEWAFVERVSTGLFLLQLGETVPGKRFLDVAQRLTGVEP